MKDCSPKRVRLPTTTTTIPAVIHLSLTKGFDFGSPLLGWKIGSWHKQQQQQFSKKKKNTGHCMGCVDPQSEYYITAAFLER